MAPSSGAWGQSRGVVEPPLLLNRRHSGVRAVHTRQILWMDIAPAAPPDSSDCQISVVYGWRQICEICPHCRGEGLIREIRVSAEALAMSDAHQLSLCCHRVTRPRESFNLLGKLPTAADKVVVLLYLTWVQGALARLHSSGRAISVRPV
jgi:hypothetical protein